MVLNLISRGRSMNDKEIQTALEDIQIFTIRAGFIITLASLIYEAFMGRRIPRTTMLLVSIILVIAVTLILIIVMLVYGLHADKTETRESLLLSKKDDVLQRWVSAQMFYIRYRDRTIRYTVSTVIFAAAVVMSLMLGERSLIALPIITSTIFLSQAAGIAKSANKMPIFSYAYRHALEKEIVDNDLLNKYQENIKNG